MDTPTHPNLEGDTLTARYWKALRQGELLFQRCQNCHQAQLPPRGRCTNCLSNELRWEESSGHAHVVSWVVYHYPFHKGYADRIPYNVAVVELDEGPRLITNIVGIENDDIRMGMRLELTIEEEDGLSLARFRPATSA
jgi:uncharacterized OB-fold protein